MNFINWISVKKRLPETYTGTLKQVLVTYVEDGEVGVTCADIYPYGNDREVFSRPGWSELNYQTTHWAEFPKPAKLKSGHLSKH